MADAVFNLCKFDRAWVGPCNKPCTGDMCSKHDTEKCCACGAPATHECDYTGQFVCGVPLCGGCEYRVDSDPNRNTGLFFMAHEHVRKEKKS